MANDNQLPIEIVIVPTKAEAQMHEFVRKAEDIFARSSAKQASSISDGFIQASNRTIANARQMMEKELALREKIATDSTARLNNILSQIGVKNPQQIAQGIGQVKEALSILEAQGVKSGVVIDQLNTKLRLLETGNARGRGEFHKMTAALASLTFEVTGAIYGFTALAGIISAPALFGTAMLKRIEDARTGVTGILLSMGTLNGKALEFGQAWAASGEYVKAVQKDSMKFGIDMGKLMEVNQAAMSGGLNAMLNLEQIQKVATAGAVAVSSLGLNSQQYVQEVRDLISGGIQPASSTLARSIGVTDALLKEWKAVGPDKLVGELTKRLQGFMVVADEVRSKTLTGAWDILQARLAMLLSNEEGFGAIKKVVMDVANFIGTVDVEGKFIFNKDMLSIVNAYWSALMSIGKVLKIISDILVFLSPLFAKVADAFTILEGEFKIGLLVVTELFNKLVQIMNLDWKKAFSKDASFSSEMSKLKGDVDAAARSFAGLGEGVKKVVTGPEIDWKKITGRPEFSDPKKGTGGGAISTEMQNMLLNLQARLGAEGKILTVTEEVNKLYIKLKDNKKALKELTMEEAYALAKVLAPLVDAKNAHEKIIDTLKKEKEHYDKLAQKEPTQLETIQSDIKVRKERLEVLGKEIELRKLLLTAPTEQEKFRELGRMGELAGNIGDLFGGKKVGPSVPTGTRAATGASTITQATLTQEDIRARLSKEYAARTGQQLAEEFSALNATVTSMGLASANIIGNETRKIEEETAKIGLTRDQQNALEIGKLQADIEKANGEDKLAYEKKLDAIRKKFFAEDVAAFSANFKNVFSDALQPGVNFMQKLGESFVAAMRKSVMDIISQKLFESMLKPTTDAFANSMGSILGQKGAGAGLGSLFSPTAGGMGLGGGALLPQLGLALGAGSLLKSAFGHGPTQFEDRRLVGAVGSQAGFQGRYEQSWTEKGGWLSSDNRGVNISAVAMPEIRKLNDTINNIRVTFGNLGSAIGMWGLGVKDFEFAINAAGDATAAIADGIGASLVPALNMFKLAGETLADTAKRLTDIFSTTTDFITSLGLSSMEAFDSIGLASTNARKALTDAAGGTDVFASLFSTFSSSILTDADRLKISLGKVGSTFAELGISGIDTKEKFAALVKAETDAGHWDIVTKLMGVSDAFGQIVDSADKAKKASEDLAKTHYKSALDAVDVLRKFASDTRDFMRSLWGGTQAPSQLSAGARRGEFLSISQLAGAGDVKAQGQLQSSATGFLEFAKTQARTSLDYARSFAFVQTALDTTASTIEDNVSAYDALLAEVANSNTYLKDISTNTSDTKNNIIDLALVTADLLKETMVGKPLTVGMAEAIKNVEDVNNKTIDILSSSGTTLDGILSGVNGTIDAVTNLNTVLAGLVSGVGGGVTGGVAGGPTVQEQIDTAVKTAAETAAAAESDAKKLADKAAAYDKWMSLEAIVTQLESWWDNLPKLVKELGGDNLLGKYNGQLFPAQAAAEKAKTIYDELPPKFALGGTHMGGYRIVGENGPELEYTGPSHITSNPDTRRLFDIEPMVNEIKELRAELRALGIPLVQNTRDAAKQLKRWDGEGMPEIRIVTE